MRAPEHRAKLLATLGTLRQGAHCATDAQLTAVLIAVMEGGLFPSDVLALNVADVVRMHRGNASRWEVKPAIRVRGSARILPLNVRMAWLRHVEHSIASGPFRALDATPFFQGERSNARLQRRTLSYQFHALLVRAGLPLMTLHELRRQAPAPIARLALAPKAERSQRRKPRRTKRPDHRSTQAPTETERSHVRGPGVRTEADHEPEQPASDPS